MCAILCVRTFFFSVEENIIQKRKKKHTLTNTHKGEASELLLWRDFPELKKKRVKKVSRRLI